MAEQETPESSYYPGARVAFVLRFDDPARKRFNRMPYGFPQSRSSRRFPLQLEMQSQPDGAILLVPKGAPAAASKLRPSQLAVGGDSLTQPVSGIIPLRASLSINGIRSASTLSLEIPFSDLPVEPRMVRGVAVDFYLGTVTASDFAAGLAGQTRVSADGNTEPLNLIPTEYKDGLQRQRTNLRFSGWVDEWEVSWTEGPPIVRLQCRDNGSLLIDTETPPMLTIDPTLPLDKAFARYLAVFPQFAGISVQWLPQGTDPPAYRPASQKASFRIPFGPPGMMGGKMSVLDYLSDIAAHLGLVVRFDGTSARLIIQQPRTIYGKKFPKRADDAFERSVGGRAMPFRMFVYGRNIADFTMKRKYTVAGPTTIEVRSYSTKLKRYLVVRYPFKKERLERGLPGTLLPDEKLSQYFFPGVEDPKTLRQIAQSIYEQLGRNEIELSLRTRDLGSFGGGALDPDVLDLRAGDTIQFEVTEDTQTGGLNFAAEAERMQASDSRAAEYMRKLGYTSEFAAAYGKARKNAILQPYFRVKRMDFSWDVEKGIDVSVTAVNYIELRGDSLPLGEEPDPGEDSESILRKLVSAAKNFDIASMLGGGGKT